MSEEQEKEPGIINYSQLPAVITQLESEVKKIADWSIEINPHTGLPDPRPERAMQVIQRLMSIVNLYATYVKDLKEELNKCAGLNASQAELIRAHGIVKGKLVTQ